MMKKPLRKTERGQAIILIAFAMIGLIGIVGLMTDGGILLIEYARLKRGIDAAAIASAQQFRRGFDAADLYSAAEGFLILNQSTADNIVVWRCKQNPSAVDGTEHDPELCTVPLRKLVRVDAERTVDFGFMRVLGFNSTVIHASSVSEAASLDLVLVFDTSSSMSFETNPAGDPNRVDADDGTNPSENPAVCNYSGTDPCQPMHDIIDVALAFINGTIFFPYDRIAVVATTSQTAGGAWNPIPVTTLPFSDDEADVVAAITSLRVLEPPACNTNPAYGSCINYDGGGNFIGFDAPHFRTTGDPTTFQSSNIGGALYQAGVEFSTPPIREDSFWVVILLAGGPANATNPVAGYPLGICPDYTWPINQASPITHPPCRDALASTRHTDTNVNYDADDYARDAADFLANPVTGMGVTVFTIGLGDLVVSAPLGDADAGEKLFEYIAETAGDESGVTVNHGAYFFAPDTSGLDEIFSLIADNIFTRLTK
ncbi:MAG: hypothetical protein QY332_09375 [Anaerolineales bacterium]|nr:MAG: hypothetical protein QY332_09375 [Anaerolineales bacterium]